LGCRRNGSAGLVKGGGTTKKKATEGDQKGKRPKTCNKRKKISRTNPVVNVREEKEGPIPVTDCLRKEEGSAEGLKNLRPKEITSLGGEGARAQRQ